MAQRGQLSQLSADQGQVLPDEQLRPVGEVLDALPPLSAAWRRLLKPALDGHDLGLISEAGLPAVADWKALGYAGDPRSMKR